MNSSIQTLQSMFEILLSKIQTGLTLDDIERALFFIIFARFLILAIRYNLKTSFYITGIGLFAGFLWYRHLVDLILLYRNVLLQIPFLSGFAEDAINMHFANTKVNGHEVINFSNPGKVFSSLITKKEIGKNSYYIDPISMLVSNLKEPYKAKILPFYYQIYNKIIPSIFLIFTKLWAQVSSIAAYALITRIGKKYCPYLVRWHWTFIIIMTFVEYPLIFLASRILYFQMFVLVPELELSPTSGELLFQQNALNFILNSVLLSHLGFTIFGLLHAIWGQYFYLPFFVENTELHIGSRPRDSIYSGGGTAWQYPYETKKNRFFPKIWFGWFGRGSAKPDYDKLTIKKIKRFRKKLFRRIKKIFRR